jgi:hypothetical protein
MLKTNADTNLSAAPTRVWISPTVVGRSPFLRKVLAQYVIALSEIEIATKTIPGNTTTHSLLNDLTKCQARRMRGLDVLRVTVPLFAEVPAGISYDSRTSRAGLLSNFEMISQSSDNSFT